MRAATCLLLSLLCVNFVVVCLVSAHDRPHVRDDPRPRSPEAVSKVSIRVEGSVRVIESNSLPDHMPGQFPNRDNPNSIRPQQLRFTVPAEPRVADEPTPYGLQPFGVAVNGVVFDPGAAEFWRGQRQWQYEPLLSDNQLGLDEHHAHVQPTGQYHYHAMPTGLLKSLGDATKQMLLIGWAADGFPIYTPMAPKNADDINSPLVEMKSSYRLKSGRRPGGREGPGGQYDGAFVADWEYVVGAGDLDECNGRVGVTPEFPEGTYYYVVTENFPYIPRLFRGTPDPSFERHGPPGGGRRGGFGPPPRGPGGRPPGPPPPRR